MKPIVFLCLAAALVAAPLRAQDGFDSALPVRGFCIAAPRPADVNRFVAFIDQELAPRHINTLVLRVDYKFQYKSHPEVADKDGLSLADVKMLVAVCRQDHIELIPQINLLGHQSFRSHLGELLRAHPEFDETPWVKMPVKYKWPNADKLYCKSYCPLAPGLHNVVFACIDELCDAFESDAFHAGMDEVFYIGESKCPRCAGKDRSVLFANEVTAIHDHLKSHGRAMWMWGDRFLDGATTGLGEWEASKVDTFRAIDRVPKDIVICDWHYDQADPTPAYFALKGFRVVSCPWKKAEVAVDQADDMARWRARVPGKMQGRFAGVMQTVWDNADGFLDKQYHGDAVATNSWNCFIALSDEVRKLAAAPSADGAK